MQKIFAAQVEVGMYLSCDIYNDKGVLLWGAGSQVSTEKQANKLIKDGYRSDLQQWIDADVKPKSTEPLEVLEDVVEIKKVFIYPTVLDALTEIQLPINHIFDVFKADAFHKEKRNLTAQITAVVDVILDVCEHHPEESFATIVMNLHGRYAIMHAIAQSVIAGLICEILDLPKEQKRSTVSAALTSNGSIVKLVDTLCKQKTAMSEEQTAIFENHPFDTLTLLTRAGIRDEEWLDTVLMHHEYLDGSGFPRGIGTDEITVMARVLAVADIYVTMILPKKIMQVAMDPPSALKRLYKKYSKRLDVGIVADVVKRFGIIPPGTFVKLKDGKIGVVVCASDDREKPIVMKVGDDPTKFYPEFSAAGKFRVTAITHPPNNLPKRIFKLWKIYADEKIKKVNIQVNPAIKSKLKPKV